MKSINLLIGKRTTLELAALFVFVLVLVANLVVLRFSEGYFEYFGISLGEVNFVPQMYDYLRIALPVIIVSVVVTGLLLCFIGSSIYIGNLLAKLTMPSKKAITYVKRHRKFFETLAYALGILSEVFLVIVSIWLLGTVLYSVSAEVGKMSAANTSEATSVSKLGDNLQKVIIYKGDSELILKTYDTSKREFVDGYSVTRDDNYEARTIDL